MVRHAIFCLCIFPVLQLGAAGHAAVVFLGNSDGSTEVRLTAFGSPLSGGPGLTETIVQPIEDRYGEANWSIDSESLQLPVEFDYRFSSISPTSDRFSAQFVAGSGLYLPNGADDGVADSWINLKLRFTLPNDSNVQIGVDSHEDGNVQFEVLDSQQQSLSRAFYLLHPEGVDSLGFEGPPDSPPKPLNYTATLPAGEYEIDLDTISIGSGRRPAVGRTATVDFEMNVSVVPEPSSLTIWLLFGLGLIGATRDRN